MIGVEGVGELHLVDRRKHAELRAKAEHEVLAMHLPAQAEHATAAADELVGHRALGIGSRTIGKIVELIVPRLVVIQHTGITSSAPHGEVVNGMDGRFLYRALFVAFAFGFFLILLSLCLGLVLLLLGLRLGTLFRLLLS